MSNIYERKPLSAHQNDCDANGRCIHEICIRKLGLREDNSASDKLTRQWWTSISQFNRSTFTTQSNVETTSKMFWCSKFCQQPPTVQQRIIRSFCSYLTEKFAFSVQKLIILKKLCKQIMWLHRNTNISYQTNRSSPCVPQKQMLIWRAVAFFRPW